MHRHQAHTAQQHQHWPENPQQKRQSHVENPVPDRVEHEPPLQQLAHVLRSHGKAASGGVGRGVDEEVDLVDEADAERVGDEGEEEKHQEGDVLDGYHELAVAA